MRVNCEEDDCEEFASYGTNLYKKKYDRDKGRAVWRCPDHR